MFDVGFWELALIAVLALVILGPERLPVVARTLGGWVRRARHFASNFGEELTGDSSIRELREEIQNLKGEIEGGARDTADRVSRMGDEVSDEVNRMGMNDDLNGHGSVDAESANNHPRSIYEFSVDDVNDVDDIPDTTVGDDDPEYDPIEGGFEHDGLNVDSERISAASSAPDTAPGHDDSRPGAENEVPVANGDQDDEALYARARQHYLATGENDSGLDGVRSEGGHSDTAHAEPSSRV